MKQCKTCIWAEKKSGVVLCPFKRCVKVDGWIADKDSKHDEVEFGIEGEEKI
jgi:hypothetical protein